MMAEDSSARLDRWQPCVLLESSKLLNKDLTWKLFGTSGVAITRTRTRNGGSGRPAMFRQEPSNGDFDEDEDSTYEEEDDEMEEEEEDELEEVAEEIKEVSDLEPLEEEMKKPTFTRVILEAKALNEVFESHCKCPQCGEQLKMEVKTICIASSIRLTCVNLNCSYVHYGNSPSAANIGDADQDNRERMTDYAINILYVLGLVSCGDGCTEAGRLLGLMGLPNNTTMERRSFPMIEERISPAIKQVSDSILMDNLVEEVRITMEKSNFDENDFQQWQQSLNGSIVLSKSKYPQLRVSYDMAWQQRSSGNRYASPSGHALFIGGYTRKPLSMVIKSKLCNYCLTYQRRNGGAAAEVPPHDCCRNHDGSSGAMEPIACLEMAVDMYRNKQCVVAFICADDDASTRSLLKWSNADHMKNNNQQEPPLVPITRGPNKGRMQVRPDRGRLPADIPEPTFVADPNHRKKVLTGELYLLEKAKVADKATMTRMDSTRIGKNFGYMIRSLPRMKSEVEYITAGKAVLEHHFDNHLYCGAWCFRSRQTPQQRQSSNRYYRNINNKEDAKLYNILSDKIERFISLDRLKEVAHGMDTQANESFNNTASWLAPKNKVYCGSKSLQNRLSLAVGINTIGLVAYFKRLFKVLGIKMTPDVEYYLGTKETTQSKRLAKIRTKDMKKKRLKNKFEQMKEDELVARNERSRREGTYQRGINMADVTGEDTGDIRQPATKKKKSRSAIVCPHCGKKGHSTTKSKQCLQYKAATNNGPPVMSSANNILDDGDAAEDLDAFDSMQLVDAANNNSDDEDGKTGVI